MHAFSVLAIHSANLLPARLQMAFTLGFHIILACLGVGLPVLMLAAEWRFLRTGDELWRTLARRWSKAFAVMFAVGAVSGTVLSFELGLLWPEFMGRWGAVIGMPFTMEGFAFFFRSDFRRHLSVRLGPIAGTRALADRLARRDIGVSVRIICRNGECVDERARRLSPR